MRTVEGFTDSAYNEFIGKDGLFWWVGEVEDNKDPEHLGRVRVRIAGYYTGANKDFPEKLKTEDLPWAVVLQPTSQAGNDGQGESSGQLQPGAIVMGFFLDGEESQQPIVMGVMRTKKKPTKGETSRFALSGKTFYEVNSATSTPGNSPGEPKKTKNANNSVQIPNIDKGATTTGNGGTTAASGSGTPTSGQQTSMGNPGTAITQLPGNNGTGKPKMNSAPAPAANGVAGPWKTLENHLKYLLEDIAQTAGNLVKREDGNFVDVVSGKITTLEELMGKVRNFLSSVFAAVIAALKEQLTITAGEAMDFGQLIAQSLGIPTIVLKLIQTILKTVLSKICGMDQMIIGMISAPYDTIMNQLVNPLIDKVQSVADMITSTVESVIDSIICKVSSAINAVKSLVNLVKSGMEVYEGVSKVAKAMKDGSGIFSKDFDIKNLTSMQVDAIGSLLGLILGFIDFGCNRQAQGGKQSAGYYPFLGVTFCDPQSLDKLQNKIGKAYGDCGKSPVGNIMDAIYRDASPYLTAAKTFVNGAYQLQMGTPGRQATVTTTASGSSHTSVKLDNNAHTKHKNREALGAKITESELEAATKKANGAQGDGAQVVGDHYQYPNHRTAEVKGDDCSHVGGDYVKTVDGDYRLKVTGDFHLEIGGGMHIHVSQAPKQVDRNGKETGQSQNTKSTIMFASDVEVDSKGEFVLQAIGTSLGAKTGTDLKLNAPKGTITANSSGTTISSGDIELKASNCIVNKATAIHQNANWPIPSPVAAAPGFFVNSAGVILMTNYPAVTNPLPQIMLTSVGEIAATAGAKGILLTTAAGAIAMTAGAAISARAGGAITMTAGAAMTLKAAAVMDLKAATILLN